MISGNATSTRMLALVSRQTGARTFCLRGVALKCQRGKSVDSGAFP